MDTTSQKLTLYQVRWVNDTIKNYTIAGGRQHGLQACTVSLLPTLVKQKIREHSDSSATTYLSPALPIPSKTELTHRFQTYS